MIQRVEFISESVDEITFLNLDPEPCSRLGCSGSGKLNIAEEIVNN